jgi:acyl-CoA synthetase (NDP forming)
VGLGGEDPGERLRALETAAQDATKPVVACVVGAGGELPTRTVWRVPNFRFPERAVRALALAADRRDWLARPLGQPLRVEGFDVEAARAVVARAGAGRLDAGDARELLSAVGIDGDRGSTVRMVLDPDLGPLVGIGDDYRLAPLTDIDAEELAPDDPAARDTIARLAALSEAVAELAAVELDPVQVTLAPAPERRRAKTW